MCTKKGWYSGKYDSTKQRKVVRCSNDGMLQYRTSIRFEILLTDMLVVTDAQWYDGTFFAKMAANYEEEFKEFMEFVEKGFENNAVPFTVRRRGDYMSMFKKPFLFSSIVNPKLQDFILHIWDDVASENDIKNACLDLTSYLNFIEGKLKQEEEDSLKADFEQFRKGIEKLDCVDKRLFVPWGGTSYIPDEIKAVKDKLEKMLEECIGSEDEECITKGQAAIKEELEQKYPSRSRILKNIEILADALYSTKLKEKFMHIFDDAYNYAIARQHDCRYYDLYDNLSNIKYNADSEKKVVFEKQKFPREVLEYLGAMTWSKFGELYYDKEIIAEREKWLRAFDANDTEVARKAFYDYLDYIIKK